MTPHLLPQVHLLGGLLSLAIKPKGAEAGCDIRLRRGALAGGAWHLDEGGAALLGRADLARERDAPAGQDPREGEQGTGGIGVF